MVGQLRILQERAPNTPKSFQAVSSSVFSRDVAWSRWHYKKNYVLSCQLGSQEINGFPLMSNSRLAFAGELKKISKECIQYTVTISHLIHD
jgi:hypothetical protein